MAKLHVVILLLAVSMLGIGGCGKESSPPKPATVPPSAPQVQAPPAADVVSVANINLGKALGPDKKVTAPTDTFAKGDTIYAVVDTVGSGNATLKARWTYHRGDKTAPVSEDSRTISANGPSTSEFHISKPDGWPPGDYQVEISLNDKSVGTKKFAVK
jgi:hypothetical protein